MDSLKTYHQVDRDDSDLSFRIAKMEAIYDTRKGETDTPHRHDFYTILLVKKGSGQHRIDFNSYTIAPQQVYFIGPGQVHQLAEQQRPEGYSLLFSEQFLIANNISVDFISDINLFHEFGESPPMELDEKALTSVDQYAQQMLTYYHSNKRFKYEAIGALLKLWLITCHNLCDLSLLDTQTMESGGTLLKKYKSLINLKYRSWHHTSPYAEAMHVTPDHLNRVVKSLTGKTAKEHLQSRITNAAKRMLFFTNLSNKEIAYSLGFSEPANFSNFFKKCTGVSPSVFKASH
ncbi:AraC family transcriptional regulator [Croceitalea sp. MTPC5]|uniref:AraC family transcriptional regulator n=1 Tax=Croceitalea sp. MTPC5 TaxID=3056565 RepID=UPI002B399E79|nr:AraC family transcriptional regulator [Croceitalea sp. MTPC5]